MAPSHSSPPASGSTGFFQQPPRLTNAFDEDEAFKRIFTFYLPPPLQQTLKPEISSFGARVLDRRVLAHLADAERNPPYLRTWDSFGHRVDELVTSEGWRALSAIGISEGMVAIAYENRYGPHSRVYQFLKYHLWSGSSAIVTCPSAMADGAARLLSRQLAKTSSDQHAQALGSTERQVFETAFRHLISRDPKSAWTSGQWMTERPGGSDVRNTETQATYTPGFSVSDSHLDTDSQPLGPWSISGFKWFSSATDSQMSVMLAKLPDGTLSAFFAPMRRQNRQTGEPELNGVQIQRLKSKLGTRALPTAELALSRMRAYMIGAPGAGVKEISTILNITRVHNIVSAVGLWGRGLAISRGFARVRSSGGRLLLDTPAHVRTLAQQHVEYRAMMHLSFLVVLLLGVSENGGVTAQLDAPVLGNSSPKMAAHLLRLVTPVAKATTARAAIAGLAECVESMGGVGYLENEDAELNIARLYRDANVLSIWEGTTNVMADDVVRVLKARDGPQVLESLDQWIQGIASVGSASSVSTSASKTLRAASTSLKAHVLAQSADNLRLNSRALLSRLGWLVCGALLVADAARDGDLVAWEVVARWMQRKETALYGFEFLEDGQSLPSLAGGDEESARGVDMDRRIVFGESVQLSQRAKM
ncbi:hypothetical protein N7474_001760 [Penicillium riverlandense]|uniref:uncharacterized protein n=1 Tax=Penicillium riverlandense TaxID=1903569 RepID=UPI002546B00B|nr:uncharacterized protein N7474_001760 [Penicillium riverlandense]KAJ5833449.1 hypothetical protein N7474_001760 [Penicillium riverlandense]